MATAQPAAAVTGLLDRAVLSPCRSAFYRGKSKHRAVPSLRENQTDGLVLCEVLSINKTRVKLSLSASPPARCFLSTSVSCQLGFGPLPLDKEQFLPHISAAE